MLVDHWPPNITIERGMPAKVLRGMYFLVKWKYASDAQSSWEPFENLKHAPESLAAYGI